MDSSNRATHRYTIPVICLISIVLLIAIYFISLNGKSEEAEDIDFLRYTTILMEPNRPTLFDDDVITLKFTDKNGKEIDDAVSESGTGTVALEIVSDKDEITKTTLHDNVNSLKESYYLSDDTGEYLLVQLGYDDDYTETMFINLRDLDNIEEPIPYSIAEELYERTYLIPMVKKINILGSYDGVRYFFIEDDQLTTEDEFLEFDYKTTLKLKHKLKAQTMENYDVELEAGDTIIPTGTDEIDVFTFITEDSQNLFLVFSRDEKNDTITVNGIDQYDMFETLPYAE